MDDDDRISRKSGGSFENIMTDLRRTAEYFDSHAAQFDALYGKRHWFQKIIDHFFRKSMRWRFDRTLAECAPLDGRSVLDIGCGPGQYAVALARRGARRVVGIDFAPAMIHLARQRAIDPGTEFIAGDFLIHQFAEQFDYVVLMGFMDYVVDPDAVIARAVSLATSKALFSFPAAGGILAWQRRRRYRNKCYLQLYSRNDLEKLFAGIPGCDVTIDRLSRDYYVTVQKNKTAG